MAVDPASVSAATQVTGAIKRAAKTTGASFDYLLATARIESNLNPQAQASTSSAKGLFQFIDQTWLATIKNSGAAHGYGAYADAISYNASSGRYEIDNPAMRNAVMQLRNDPAASATMAGAFTRNNAGQLAGALGRRATDGELYIAHFMGPEGAGRLINAANSQPNTPAADIFPVAAQSNRNIFYDRSGRARGTAEVYAALANKYDSARVASMAPGLRGSVSPADVASAGYVQDSLTERLAPIANAAMAQRVAAAPTAQVANAYAQVQQNQVMATLAGNARETTGNEPLFRSMFSSRGDSPVAPVVQALWQGRSGDVPAAKTKAVADTQLLSGQSVSTLQLFQDIQPGGVSNTLGIGRPGFSGMFSDDG
jgi:hypothetical protein